MLELHNDYWQLNFAGNASPLALTTASNMVTAAEWCAAVHECYQFILQQPGDTVLLYQPDVLQFSIAFVALAQAGKHIVLAPDGQSTTLELAAKSCDWQLSQTFSVQPHSANPATVYFSTHCQVSFFTSGSSGQPKLICKSVSQLLREVQTLQQQFASQLAPDVLVAGTVSVQHIYGLLFRFLLPLCSQRPFYSPQLEYLEQWLQLLQQYKTLFVASPAHLARFDDLVKLQPCAGNIAGIFSSGGPLADAEPPRYVQTVGLAPVEVYGSTETGGIAFRQRDGKDQAWQLFDAVQVSQDERGALQLVSPHLPDNAPYQTEDQIELISARQFVLLGRLDRIVKLEEKRLSLTELEQYCLLSPLIVAAAALVLDSGRKQLALAVQLSDDGRALLQQHGKLALNRQIKLHLSQRFEPVLLPKRFRYPDALPYNAQGKLPRAQLEALFSDH